MLMILAVFSIFFGFITKDMFIGLGSGFFSDNALFIHPSHEIMLDTEFGVPTLFKLLPLIFTISLSVIAIVLSEYLSTILIYFKLSRVGYNIFSFFNQRFLIELFYNRYITGIILKLGGQTTKVIDKGSVEYLGPYGLEKGLLNISNNIAKLNTGVITSYALYILIALILYLLFNSYINHSIIILALCLSLSLVSFKSSVGINTLYTSTSLPLQSTSCPGCGLLLGFYIQGMACPRCGNPLSHLTGPSQADLDAFIKSLKNPEDRKPEDKKSSNHSKFSNLSLITVTLLGVISTISVTYLFISYIPDINLTGFVTASCDAPRGWGLYFKDSNRYFQYSAAVYFYTFFALLFWVRVTAILIYNKTYVKSYVKDGYYKWAGLILYFILANLSIASLFKLFSFLRPLYALFFFICSLDLDFSIIGTADAMSGNTFSTPNDDIANCEHPSDKRVEVTDCNDFANSQVNCSYCDEPALNGTEGQQAILCHDCGATICENCNAPNSD